MPTGAAGAGPARMPAAEPRHASSTPSLDALLANSSADDWFAGEGDEEEDAEDDGAGYGSLIAIGLGSRHQPRVDALRGEAGLAPAPFAEQANLPVPQGRGPQDFRLREALEQLRRL